MKTFQNAMAELVNIDLSQTEQVRTKLAWFKGIQKTFIESLATPTPWVKQEIITICDEQISALPELDQDRYIVSLKTMEHPGGIPLQIDVHPTIRIREGAIVRDTNNRAEAFFWLPDFYEKMKKKATKNYFIGGQRGVYLENYWRLRNKIRNQRDGELLSYKVARSCNPLEVFELPAEQRTAVLVTDELAKALGGKIVASYNMDDPQCFDPVEPGDILVQDPAEETAGLYYRVDMRQVAETYRQGTL